MKYLIPLRFDIKSLREMIEERLLTVPPHSLFNKKFNFNFFLN
jgi:hypothetical protein